jgi:hypothetical protein
VPVAGLSTRPLDLPDPVPIMVAYQTNRLMTRYDVICPSAPWENTTTDADRAYDLCYDLAEEHGYCEIRDNATGIVIADYGNPATFLEWR